MSTINSQFGAAAESAFGSIATPTRFWQHTKADLDVKQVRLVGTGLRSTGWMERSDQARVAVQGGTLKTEMEWMTKGMGWWLTYLLGTVVTTGPTDSAYTHTGTMASLYGKFFTSQVNLPLHPAGTDQPMTLGGCKVASWELSCDVDGIMTFAPEIDAQNVATGTALASASYASSAAPYTWVDLALTYNGTAVPVKSWKVSVDNGLDVERYKQQGSALKQEQTHKDRRKVNVELEADFSDLANFYNRARATTAANSMAQLVLTATCGDSGVTVGVSTNPSTTITIPKFQMTDIKGLAASAPSAGGIMQKITGRALWDGTNSPMTVAYVSADGTA